VSGAIDGACAVLERLARHPAKFTLNLERIPA
jgi:hypothetical protein